MSDKKDKKVKKSEQKEIDQIKTGGLARGLSLLNLAVSTTVKLAGKKISDPFYSEEKKVERFSNFLLERAAVLVKELEVLKGSVMKAGQMLSVYGEHFFPAEVNNILKALQSDSAPVSWKEMEKVLNRQLGKDWSKKIELNQTPLAAASMGQVYEARYKGKEIVLKVQYPGVDKAIDSDLKALKRIVSSFKMIPNSKGLDELFKEIRMMLHYEADYHRELETLKWYKNQLSGQDLYIVPDPIEELCTKRVVAMQRMYGLRIDNEEVLGLPQDRRNRLSEGFLRLYFAEAFEWKTVQTDPHFGNYLIKLKEDGNDQIILLDFGAVRHFPKRYIEPFGAMALASIEEDPIKIIESAHQLGFLKENDSQKVEDLFAKICLTGATPFQKHHDPEFDGKPFRFGDNNLVEILTGMGKDAVFAFKLRPPPREAVFMDRKLVGTYMILKALGYEAGPYSIAQEYLESYSS